MREWRTTPWPEKITLGCTATLLFLLHALFSNKGQLLTTVRNNQIGRFRLAVFLIDQTAFREQSGKHPEK